MGHIQCKILLLVLMTATCFGRFNRDCGHYSHCIFSPKESHARQYLACNQDGKCACEKYRRIADVPSWRLDNSDGECRIAVSGPCGEDDGLEVKCEVGHECMKGRCRDPEKLGKTPLNYACIDELDCEPGLVCKATGFQYRILKSCVTPETPEYEYEP